MSIRYITTVALLATIIVVLVSLKVPSTLLGTEFQLSAPIAVSIFTVYGFISSLASFASSISLILGTQTIFNIIIALLFHLTVCLVLVFGGTFFVPVVFAGPLGSFVARPSLVLIMQQAVWAVTLSTVSAMIYTTLAACLIAKALRRIAEGEGSHAL